MKQFIGIKMRLILSNVVIILIIKVDSTNIVESDDISVNGQLCLDRISELDKCLPKLVVYGDRNFDPPKNDSQLDKHCLLLDDNLRCVSSYSRQCLPSFARNIYSVMTRRLKTQFAKRCKSKDGRRDFLNLMACGDRQYMEPAHRCMDSFIANLEHINRAEYKNQNRQIELICCTFQLFQECIFTASKRVDCPKRIVTADKAIDYVKTIINSMGGDIMDLMCSRYNKISNCFAEHPKIMSQFKNINEKILNGTMKPQHNSPLRPMLELFINIQDS